VVVDDQNLQRPHAVPPDVPQMPFPVGSPSVPVAAKD